MKCSLFLVWLIVFIKNSDELNCKRDRSILVSPELQLKYALFCDYESGVLPERNISVNFDMIPVYFWFSRYWEFDPRIKFECNLTYVDKNLKWSPADHNNIETIAVDGVKDIKLWMPKISFDHALDKDNTLDDCATLGCSIHSNGSVYCAFICDIAAWCDSEFRRWPFDRKYCYVDITTHYSTSEIQLTSRATDLDTFKYAKNSHWDINQIQSYYRYRYDDTELPAEWNMTKIETINFRAVRHSSQDVNTIFVPLLIFTVVNMLVFITDLRSSTRILLLILSILIHMSFLSFMSWTVPKYKDNIPGVIFYFIDSMTLSMLLVIETAILRKIGKSNDGPQSGFVRQMLSVVDDTFFGWLFVIQPEFSDIRADFPFLRALKIGHGSDDNLKWWQFVKIIDRFCLLIFVALYLFGLFMSMRYTIL